MILELGQAAAAVERFRSEPCGTLRISASVVMGQVLMRPVLTEFLGLHPAVQVIVELSNRRVDLLEEGFDLALRAGTLPDSGLIARRVGHAGARLFASPAYLKRRGLPRRPADLPDHDLLEGSPTLSTAGWTLRHDGSDAVEQVIARFRLVANDAVVLEAAALAGLGIASLPTFAVQDEIADGRLKPVLPDWSTRHLDIHAVFPSHKSLSPALRAFVELTAQRLQEREAAGTLPVNTRRRGAREQGPGRPAAARTA